MNFVALKKAVAGDPQKIAELDATIRIYQAEKAIATAKGDTSRILQNEAVLNNAVVKIVDGMSLDKSTKASIFSEPGYIEKDGTICR